MNENELKKIINKEEDVLYLNFLVLNNKELDLVLRALSIVKDYRLEYTEVCKELYLKICKQVNGE